MKKIIAITLLAAMLLLAAACGKESTGNDIVDLSNPASSPAGSASPSASPSDALPVGSPDAAGSTGTPTIDMPTVSPGPAFTPAANAIDEDGQHANEKTPAPTPTPGQVMPKNLSEAQKLNKAVVGWIKISGTKIDYPILYGKNYYYNDHDIFKNKTGNPGKGSIYSWHENASRNIIISGHNMRSSGEMFHDLHALQNKGASMNKTFKIDIFGTKEWEVFAFYETKDNEPASTLEYNTKHLTVTPDKDNTKEVEEWIAKQKSRSEADMGVSVSGKSLQDGGDMLMTIITCGDNYDSPVAQSRLYFFLKKVK